MDPQQPFRILTPDGLLSRDTFVLAAKQPRGIKSHCLLVVNRQSGGVITVHQTRLVPIQGVPVEKPKSVCWKCGRVDGVVLDRVACPEHHGTTCGMLEPADKP